MSDGDSEDLRLMRAALALGRRSMGRAAPNPSVGAIVVKGGAVIGRGVTAPGGRPHAEPMALAEAGEAARGATLYVTLEPCSHHGRTPPCAEAVIAAGVARVVVALGDPDHRVAGRGSAMLRAAGIEVVEGVAAAEARADHLGHVLRVTRGRPMVTVKMAETPDGYAGAPLSEGRLVITGAAANAEVQMLRATHDAVMVGRGTALDDDPLLTVRLPGMGVGHPLRVVLDPGLNIPLGSRLIVTASAVPLLVLAAPDAAVDREAALADRAVSVSRVAAGPRGLDPAAVLAELGARGITRLLCEGGPRLASTLIEADLADRVVMFTGSKRLDREGRETLTAAARSRIEDAHTYLRGEAVPFGKDLMRRYDKAETCSPG